jgi:hypothetical protein
LFRHTELSLEDVSEEIDTPIQSSTVINENNSEKPAQPIIPPLLSTPKVEQIEDTTALLSTPKVEQIEDSNMQINSQESIEETNMMNSVELTEETSMPVNSIESAEDTNMQVNSVETSESLVHSESKSEISSSQLQEMGEMEIDIKSPDGHDSTIKSPEDLGLVEKVNITQVEQTSDAQTSSVTMPVEHFDRDVKVFNPPPENVTLLAQSKNKEG